MKKILPFLIIAITFTIFLAGQVGFDYLSTRASFLGKESSKVKYFSNTFKRLKVKSLSGKTIDFANNETPIVVINFWASWCAPCIKEFPSLQKLKGQFKKNELMVLAVNTDDSELDQAKRLIEKRIGSSLDFEFISDDNKLTRLFEVNSIPTTVIFVRGKVYNIIDGGTDFSDHSLILDLKKQI